MLRPRGSKWLPSPPLRRWVVVVLRCALVSGLRSVCGFDVWVAGFGFGGFRHLGCWISGVMVEMVVVVGRFAVVGRTGVGSICDGWVQFVICGVGSI